MDKKIKIKETFLFKNLTEIHQNFLQSRDTGIGCTENLCQYVHQ